MVDPGEDMVLSIHIGIEEVYTVMVKGRRKRRDKREAEAEI